MAELISITDLSTILSKKLAKFSTSFQKPELKQRFQEYVTKIVNGQYNEDQMKEAVQKIIELLNTEGGNYESLQVFEVLNENGSRVGKSQMLPSTNQVKIEPAVLQSQIIAKSFLSNCKKRSTVDLNEGNISDNVSNAPKKLRIDKPEKKVVDNMFEAQLRSHVVTPNEIDATLEDIGALEETKSLIQGLVIAPIKCPQLFKSGLLQPCKDILLFGPPGTGKKMLAKAIARDCGAHLINVPSTYFFDRPGNPAEHMKALFTLAAKIAPAVIFIDDIDIMLGKKTSGNFSEYQNIDFLSHWDSLRTKAKEYVIVLGTTDKPYDLDVPIIKKFERRIFVDLPSEKCRELILRKILEKENVDGIDFKEIAAITDGYSGSDLKKLCAAAAYQPLVDLFEQQRSAPAADSENLREKPILRPLNMGDLRQAKNKVSARPIGPSRVELKKWNDLYGDRGSKIK